MDAFSEFVVKSVSEYQKFAVKNVVRTRKFVAFFVIRWYTPVFDSDIWKNTAERLILYSFFGGAFSFYDIVFFDEN